MVTCIERHAGQSNGGSPEEPWRLHAWSGVLVQGGTGRTGEIACIRAAEGNGRPAVVAAASNNVDLVTALRTVFVFPDFAGDRVNNDCHRVPNAKRIQFAFVPGAPGERIVERDAPVVVETQNLAEVARRILRIRHRCQPRASVIGKGDADGQVNLAVAAKHETRSRRPGDHRVGDEDVTYLRHCFPIEAAAGQDDRRGFLITGFFSVIGEVHPLVLDKARMQGNVVQTLQIPVGNRRHPGNRGRVEHSVPHDPDSPGAFRDQHVAVGQKRQRVWMRKSLHRHHPELRSGD